MIKNIEQKISVLSPAMKVSGVTEGKQGNAVLISGKREKKKYSLCKQFYKIEVTGFDMSAYFNLDERSFFVLRIRISTVKIFYGGAQLSLGLLFDVHPQETHDQNYYMFDYTSWIVFDTRLLISALKLAQIII